MAPDSQLPNGAAPGPSLALVVALLAAMIALIGMVRTQHGCEGGAFGRWQIGRVRLRRIIALAGLSFAMTAVLAACGGGTNGPSANTPADPATPAGTYTVTVTGTTNTSASQSIVLTLTVQ